MCRLASDNLCRLSFVVRNLATAGRGSKWAVCEWAVQSDDHSVIDCIARHTAAEIYSSRVRHFTARSVCIEWGAVTMHDWTSSFRTLPFLEFVRILYNFAVMEFCRFQFWHPCSTKNFMQSSNNFSTESSPGTGFRQFTASSNHFLGERCSSFIHSLRKFSAQRMTSFQTLSKDLEVVTNELNFARLEGGGLSSWEAC